MHMELPKPVLECSRCGSRDTKKAHKCEADGAQEITKCKQCGHAAITGFVPAPKKEEYDPAAYTYTYENVQTF